MVVSVTSSHAIDAVDHGCWTSQAFMWGRQSEAIPHDVHIRLGKLWKTKPVGRVRTIALG
jgi:hypothetical protein